MARIGVDLDGVGYDFHLSYWEYATESTDLAVPPQPPNDPTEYYWFRVWGWTDEQYREHADAGASSGKIFSGPVIPGFVEGLNILREAGHTLHIVTARGYGTPGVAEKTTRVWLDEHQVPYDELIFNSDKTVIETDYFIEDNEKNYDRLDETNCVPFLVDRGWNQEPDDGRRRVDGVRHFALEVLYAEGQL